MSVPAGQPATFTVAASGQAPLSYQWQRDRANIGGATGTSYTLPAAQAGDEGALFRCIVTNWSGTAQSREALLTVVENTPPVAAITAPAVGTTYAGGNVIAYAGTATDAEDGALPRAAFTWRVDFHHDAHVHPFIADRTGKKQVQFTIPTEGETAANVWYRIHLTVVDSDGGSHTVFRDLQPRTTTIRLVTSPPGLSLLLDGQPVTTPHTFVGVEGERRRIAAPTPQTSGPTTYRFDHWSDAGRRSHVITTPVGDTTYTAFFR